MRTLKTLAAYIPMDRRQAMARQKLALGKALPNRTTGAALFADVSGFTPLAEALVEQLGPKRAAEELTRQLNRVYDALIAEVHRYGGSVIGFVGDAITCWFDDDSGHRATACALAMQRAMEPFAAVHIPSGGTVSLTIKVGIAAGPVHRFCVGDPQIQTIDVLAGNTLRQMSLAEGTAQKREVLLDASTVANVKDDVTIAEWRPHPKTGERFAIVTQLETSVSPSPWPDLSETSDWSLF